MRTLAFVFALFLSIPAFAQEAALRSQSAQITQVQFLPSGELAIGSGGAIIALDLRTGTKRYVFGDKAAQRARPQVFSLSLARNSGFGVGLGNGGIITFPLDASGAGGTVLSGLAPGIARSLEQTLPAQNASILSGAKTQGRIGRVNYQFVEIDTTGSVLALSGIAEISNTTHIAKSVPYFALFSIIGTGASQRFVLRHAVGFAQGFGPSTSAPNIRLSPDGSKLVHWSKSARSIRRQASLYNTQSGGIEMTIDNASSISEVAFSPDGSLLFVRGNGVSVWSVADGRAMTVWPKLSTKFMTFTHDQRLMLTSKGSIALTDPQEDWSKAAASMTPPKAFRLKNPGYNYYTAAVSGNGLAAVLYEGPIGIYDIESRSLLMLLWLLPDARGWFINYPDGTYYLTDSAEDLIVMRQSRKNFPVTAAFENERRRTSWSLGVSN